MILARHGQTEFNVIYGATRQDPGLVDPGLTETGRGQADALAALLRGRPVRAIMTSPYTRALQTADIVARTLDLPVSVEPLVRERRVFACDVGTLARDLAARWPHFDFSHLEDRWWPEDEESETALLERCGVFRRHMAARDGWAEVVVISHWGFIRGLTGQALTNGATIGFDPT